MVLLFSNDSAVGTAPTERLRACGEVLVNLAASRAGLLMLVDASGDIHGRLSVGAASGGEGHCTAADLSLLARQAPPGECDFVGLPPCHTLVQRLLGEPPAGFGHAVIGRISCDNGLALIVVAGWRANPPDALECAILKRGGVVCRDAMREVLASSGSGLSEGGRGAGYFDFLNAVASPVFRVDERMTIITRNEAGRRELQHGAVLQEMAGRLTHTSCDGMEELRTAVRRSLRDVAGEGRRSSIVPLTSETGLPRFAIVAPSPLHGNDPTCLVVLPVVDSDEGARRLAALYHLTPAEEKVVRLILTGASPVAIGAELTLTEATVRTYLKRIMLKLGINRRSEFFLLYILTMSPFRFGGDCCHPVGHNRGRRADSSERR